MSTKVGKARNCDLVIGNCFLVGICFRSYKTSEVKSHPQELIDRKTFFEFTKPKRVKNLGGLVRNNFLEIGDWNLELVWKSVFAKKQLRRTGL